MKILNMNKNKLQIKDLITLGILNAVFLFLLFIIGMILGIMPVTYILIPAIASVPLGLVFMLIVSKVKKKGALLISGVVQALVILFSGSIWTISFSILIAAVISEIIMHGHYTDFKRIMISYIYFISAYCVGGLAPIAFFSDSFRNATISRGYDSLFIDNLISFLSIPLFLFVFLVSVAGSILGAFIGKKFLNKHFIKAGVV